MKLSEHEQQMLDEIQQGVLAEDPEFYASMAGSPSHRGRSVRGGVTFLFGLVAFMVSAILAQASPGWGVIVSLVGFLTMFWGMAVLCSGHRAFPQHEQESALQHRVGGLWDSMKDPPPQGMSP